MAWPPCPLRLQVRDSATEVPADYEPPTFQSKASPSPAAVCSLLCALCRRCMLCASCCAQCWTHCAWPFFSGKHMGERLVTWTRSTMRPPAPTLQQLTPSPQPRCALELQALQHTNVSLSWDAEDEGRKRALTKKMTADDIREDDFAVRFLLRPLLVAVAQL